MQSIHVSEIMRLKVLIENKTETQKSKTQSVATTATRACTTHRQHVTQQTRKWSAQHPQSHQTIQQNKRSNPTKQIEIKRESEDKRNITQSEV